jgi:hypothetical protein
MQPDRSIALFGHGRDMNCAYFPKPFLRLGDLGIWSFSAKISPKRRHI